MSDNRELPAYSEIDELLKQSGSMQQPAECHGLLSALLCSNHEAISIWLSELHSDSSDGDLQVSEAREMLEGFAAVVKVQLHGADFSYELMLPADDESLQGRTRALAQWCQGFYLGLGIAGIKDLDDLPEDSRDIVKDMTEIGRIENHDEQPLASEEDEAAYAELVEYLRVGVLLIFEQLYKPAKVTEH